VVQLFNEKNTGHLLDNFPPLWVYAYNGMKPAMRRSVSVALRIAGSRHGWISDFQVVGSKYSRMRHGGAAVSTVMILVSSGPLSMPICPCTNSVADRKRRVSLS